MGMGQTYRQTDGSQHRLMPDAPSDAGHNNSAVVVTSVNYDKLHET